MRLLERTMVKFWKTEIAFKIVLTCACIDGEVTKLELVSCPFYVRFRSTSTNLRLFRDLLPFSYDHIDSDFTIICLSHQGIFDPILTEFDRFWQYYLGNGNQRMPLCRNRARNDQSAGRLISTSGTPE